MVGYGNRGLCIGCTLGNNYRSSGDHLCALIVPKAMKLCCPQKGRTSRNFIISFFLYFCSLYDYIIIIPELAKIQFRDFVNYEKQSRSLSISRMSLLTCCVVSEENASVCAGRGTAPRRSSTIWRIFASSILGSIPEKVNCTLELSSQSSG